MLVIRKQLRSIMNINQNLEENELKNSLKHIKMKSGKLK